MISFKEYLNEESGKLTKKQESFIAEIKKIINIDLNNYLDDSFKYKRNMFYITIDKNKDNTLRNLSSLSAETYKGYGQGKIDFRLEPAGPNRYAVIMNHDKPFMNL